MSHISISRYNTSSSMAFKSKFNQHIHLVQCIPTLVLRWKQVLNHVCHVWFQSKCLWSAYKHKSKPIWIVRLRRYYIAIFTFTCKRRKTVSISGYHLNQQKRKGSKRIYVNSYLICIYHSTFIKTYEYSIDNDVGITRLTSAIFVRQLELKDR